MRSKSLPQVAGIEVNPLKRLERCFALCMNEHCMFRFIVFLSGPTAVGGPCLLFQ